MLEQGPDFWRWFDKIQFSYHCVHPIHAKMFSIQMLLHFSQILLRVCTLVLFIIININSTIAIYNNTYCSKYYAGWTVSGSSMSASHYIVSYCVYNYNSIADHDYNNCSIYNCTPCRSSFQKVNLCYNNYTM